MAEMRWSTILSAAVFWSALALNVSASELCSTQMSVRKNGDVVMDGEIYSTPNAFRARLVELKSRNPSCFMNVRAEKGTEIETMERVAAVLRRLGIPQVGFLTEPRNP